MSASSPMYADRWRHLETFQQIARNPGMWIGDLISKDSFRRLKKAGLVSERPSLGFDPLHQTKRPRLTWRGRILWALITRISQEPIP